MGVLSGQRGGGGGGGGGRPSGALGCRPRRLHVLLLAVGAICTLLLRLGVKTGMLSTCTLLGVRCAGGGSHEAMRASFGFGRVSGLALVRREHQQEQEQQHKSQQHAGPPSQSPSRQGERLLFMLSSFDRGERLSGSWEKGKDKMPVILQVVDLARALCERGYDVAVAFISAWPASEPEPRAQIEGRLRCDRIGGTAPPVTYWDHYNTSIGGKLAYQHRLLLKEEVHNYDFFIQVGGDTVKCLYN